ncbi:hypothetical protein QE392_000639 [Microbacterium proteolyticum]|nr:hypothetical protein [Microbacterium sp. SORGH_AS_0344]MDQ1168835.1 hypothetical protein [Microbacterium proteolyticum]
MTSPSLRSFCWVCGLTATPACQTHAPPLVVPRHDGTPSPQE